MMTDHVSEVNLLKLFFIIYSIPWTLQMVSLIYVFVATGTGHASGSFYLIITNMYVISILPILILPRLFESVNMGVIITLALIELLTFMNSLGYNLKGNWARRRMTSEEDRNLEEHEEVEEISQ